MMLSSVATPAAICAGICFRRHAAPCSLGISAAGVTSPSKKLFFSSSTSSNLVQKDAVLGWQAVAFNLLDRISVHAVGAKAVSYVEADAEIQDLKNYIEGDLELTFDAVVSDPDATTLDVSASEVSTSSRAKTSSKKGKNPMQLSTSASQIPKLDFLQVFKYPLGTESAIKAMLECNTLVFVVDKRADKKIIRDAAKNMFKIRVKKVNTSMTPDGTKKAYLMLARDCNAADVAKKIKIL